MKNEILPTFKEYSLFVVFGLSRTVRVECEDGQEFVLFLLFVGLVAAVLLALLLVVVDLLPTWSCAVVGGVVCPTI